VLCCCNVSANIHAATICTAAVNIRQYLARAAWNLKGKVLAASAPAIEQVTQALEALKPMDRFRPVNLPAASFSLHCLLNCSVRIKHRLKLLTALLSPSSFCKHLFVCRLIHEAVCPQVLIALPIALIKVGIARMLLLLKRQTACRGEAGS